MIGKARAGRATRVHPLLWPTLGLIIGIWLADLWPRPETWALAALIAAGLSLILWLILGPARGRHRLTWLAVSFLILGAGLIWWQRAQPLPADHLRALADNTPRLLVAQVIAAPQPSGRSLRLIARTESVDGRPASGLIQLYLPAEAPEPGVGHRLRALVKLKPVTGFANPGGFDYAEHLAQQDLYVQAYAGRRADLADLGPGEMTPALGLEAARQRLGRVMAGLDRGEAAGLIRALVLGQRGGLTPETRQAFAATGTAHLLAISGLHLGLVWGWSYLALRFVLAAWPGLALRFGAPRPAAALALMPALAYALIAGGSTPTLRALIMAACLVAALWAARPYRADGGLALAAMVIALIWPEAPLTLSFQLSFTAVAAILLAAAPLAHRLRGRAGWRKWLGALAGWLALSGLVALGTWPLTVLHFHAAPWLSLMANAVAIPLIATIALPLALAGSALALIWPGGGAWLLGLALWPAGAGLNAVQWLAALPGAVTYLAGPGPWAVALIYAAALALLALPRPWRWAAGGALAALALAVGLMEARTPPPDGLLRVWVVDVGQGSAAVARLPDGQVLVVDAGGGHASLDTGQAVLAPLLWHLRLGRVDWLAASHPHPDHAGGLPFLARWFAPAEVWTNGEPGGKGPYAELLRLAAERGTRVKGPAELMARTELGGARLLLAWPTPSTDLARYSENDRSLWLGLGLGSTWLWLPGDNGAKIERAIAPGLPEGGDQVLVAAHHGGRGSCTEALLARLRPLAVVFSAGCANGFGMPRPEVRARAAAAGAAMYYTGSQGCIALVSDGKEWRISPYLDPPRDCPLP
ncbi:MAG: DNA internalization-related competence protein ComEC/Rec2 [Pseudomonadota bacterium]